MFFFGFWVGLVRREHPLGVFERESTSGHSGVGGCLYCTFSTEELLADMVREDEA